MKTTILILASIFLSHVFVFGQITNEAKCEIYSEILNKLQLQITLDYDQNGLFVANQLLIIEDFPNFIGSINPLFSDTLIDISIDYTQFVNRTDDFNFDCLKKRFKIKQEMEYFSKQKRYSKRKKAICFLSNIGFYDNFAFVAVSVQLSYSRRYSNFYFFKKNSNWDIIYFKEGCD